MTSETSHWDKVWSQADPTAVSWFQPETQLSIRLISDFGHGPTDSVVDVGSGASNLIGELVEAGYRDIEVLDIAAPALGLARLNLTLSTGVAFTVADIVEHRFERSFDIWHDRAVFHFLVSDEDRLGYLEALRSGLEFGGVAIIATFRLGGPEVCSGLGVQQYSPETLSAVLPGFELIAAEFEEHFKPNGDSQAFQYSVFRRVS